MQIFIHLGFLFTAISLGLFSLMFYYMVPIIENCHQGANSRDAQIWPFDQFHELICYRFKKNTIISAAICAASGIFAIVMFIMARIKNAKIGGFAACNFPIMIALAAGIFCLIAPMTMCATGHIEELGYSFYLYYVSPRFIFNTFYTFNSCFLHTPLGYIGAIAMPIVFLVFSIIAIADITKNNIIEHLRRDYNLFLD